MLRKRVAESLTARIFLITACILLCAGGVTFGLIAWATPSTYTAVVTDDLTAQVDTLVENLTGTALEDCGPILDDFILSSGAAAMLVGPDGQLADTNSQLAVQSMYEDDSVVITSSEGDSAVPYAADAVDAPDGGSTVAVTMSEQAAISTEVWFAGQEAPCTLYVTPRMEAENLAVRALAQMAPWILLVLLIFSLLCALVYSRYITRPIVRLSGIAGKMAQLDFQWESGEKRRDEIGRLGRSLDQMARKLSAALTDLEGANRALRGEVERERELDRQRMAFFNAASHELKTPVTILKGQLSGMLEGVGVYQDRDKYLLRSLQTTGRMERLIGEMLSITRMGEDTRITKQPEAAEEVLGEVARKFRKHYPDVKISVAVPDELLIVPMDAILIEQVMTNLLENAVRHGKNTTHIALSVHQEGENAVFAVQDNGGGIPSKLLPVLFSGTLRHSDTPTGDGKRNMGLGLSVCNAIVRAHGGTMHAQNKDGGAEFTFRLPMIEKEPELQ